MIEVTDKSQCNGCGACCAICPRKCIVMKADEEGFFYPNANKDECVECGLCERGCPILSKKTMCQEPEAWACICSDEKIRLESSSGGIFTLLAERILEQGGIVYGAAFDRDWNVAHISVERKEELGKLRGSKYVQSKTGDCYRETRLWLESGRLVYFSGTPCQIDGLKAYLQRDYENLFCQDLICHGVPSSRVWQAYINSLGGKEEWKQISFREKKSGWRNYYMSISDGKTRREQCYRENSYMKLFLENISLRPSCYVCHSKGYGRHSDLTLGDFWGVEKIAPDMDDDKGISLVLIQTQKGKALLEEVGSRILRRQVGLKEAVDGNPSLLRSADYPARKREWIFRELQSQQFNERNFAQLVEKITAKSLWKKSKEAVWKLLYVRK